MRLVATDWLTSKNRIDHLASRADSCVQLAIRRAKKDIETELPFFLIINLQVSTAYFWQQIEGFDAGKRSCITT
jgi:hypothetical protein